jgi:hypothetical protein
MKITEIEKTCSVGETLDLIRRSSKSSSGICIIAINDNPLTRNSFYEQLKEGLEKGADQGDDISYREWNFSASQEFRTIEEYLFPKDPFDKSRMNSHRRDEQKRSFRGQVRILVDAQDLSLNTASEKKIDMALIRELVSKHGLIAVILAPKSIMNMIELDNDLSYYSMVSRIV